MNITRKINLPKVTEIENVEAMSMEKVLKECIITIPKNVVDVDYFVQAVQFHIYSITVNDVNARLQSAINKLAELEKADKKWTRAWENAEKLRNDNNTLLHLLEMASFDLDKDLSNEYEDIKAVKSVFREDMFAKLYAWSILDIKSYKYWKDNKSEEIHLHVRNEDKVINYLKEFDNASGNAEGKKSACKNLEQLANDTFATNGGELYKNISFKLSVEKINTNLYSRFKEPLKHDGKGNLKDIQRQPFTMMMQLFAVCLIQLGVPTINGQKVIKVDDVANCNQALTVARKKKEK